MPVYDGDELYSIITGDQDLLIKKQILNEFKGHVKREFVDLAYIPKNFDTMIAAINLKDPELSSIAFSTICHLVKRVSMQDISILQNCYYSVIPCLIQKLADPKPSISSASTKALQVYWSCCPNEVDNMIKQNGLNSYNIVVRDNCLRFLIMLIERHQQSFMFKPFTPTIVSFLRIDVAISTQQLAMMLLIKFFKNSTSRNAKLDLINEFMKQSINKTIVHSILSDIDPSLINDFNQLAYSHPSILSSDEDNLNFINSGSIKITTSNQNYLHHQLSKSKSSQSLRPKSGINRPKTQVIDVGYDEIMSDSSLHSITTTRTGLEHKNGEVEEFLNKIQGYQLENIKGVRISNVAKLRQEVEDLLPPFNGKETEFNWTAREKNIIYLRSVLRGNCPLDFPEELSQCFRALCDSMTKAVSSLRTSLSSNGCLLVKELAVFLGDHLDNVTIDVCATTLLKLTGATKKIASQNAMVAFSSLIANISHHQRLFNQIIAAAQDKNVQPRLYSSTWIQIYILKNHDILENANSGAALDQLGKSIVKCLSDPNPTVRESMRSTFWCFYKYWSLIGDTALLKLDLSTKKALERSRPQSISTSGVIAPVRTPKKRQSIRELIVAKNRSTNTNSHHHSLPSSSSSTSLNSSVPRSQSGGGIPADIGKPLRVGMAQKAKRVSSFKTSSLAAAGIANRSKSEEIKTQNLKNSNSTNSVREIFNRTPSQVEPMEAQSHSSEKLVNNDTEIQKNEEFLPVEKQEEEDMIVKLLRSELTEMKAEGISLLKYALISNEDIPSNIDELLESISINHPVLLKPLYDLDLLAETLKHISADNFLRTFIICQDSTNENVDISIDDRLITVLVDATSVDEVYMTCAQLINISNNVTLVINGKLTMQFIKYKKTIFQFLNKLLLQILNSFPISDFSFTKLSDVLFLSIDFFRTSEELEDLTNYIKLIQLLFEIKPSLFKSCLLSHGESVTESICSLATININEVSQEMVMADSGSDDMVTVDGVQISSLYEMTMIQPNGIKQNVPLNYMEQGLNDMTMIMPNFSKSKNATTNSIKENIMEEDEDDDSIFQHHGLNFQKAEKEVHHSVVEDQIELDQMNENVVSELQVEYQEQNESDDQLENNGDIEMGETQVDGLPEFMEKSNTQHDANDATTVMIQNQKVPNESELQDDHESASSSHELINQIRNVNITSPPATLTSSGSDIENIINKSDPFSNLAGDKSIQIYEDQEDETDEIVLIGHDPSYENDMDTWYAFQLEKYLNVDLKASISKSFVDNLRSSCLSSTASTDDWLLFMIIVLQAPQLLVTIEQAVLFLESVEVNSDNMIYGLTILVHNLKKLEKDLLTEDQFASIWNIVIFKLSQHCQYFANELWFAVLDVIRELICKNYKLALKVTTSQFFNSSQVLIALFVLKIIVKQEKNLSIEETQEITEFCLKYANDDEVTIRRTVIIIFSSLSKTDGKNFGFSEIRHGLSLLQTKLIEEYAMLI